METRIGKIAKQIPGMTYSHNSSSDRKLFVIILLCQSNQLMQLTGEKVLYGERHVFFLSDYGFNITFQFTPQSE
jgi:hypothetical protein